MAWAVDYASSTSAPLRIVVVYQPDALEDELLAAGAPSDSSQPRALRVAQQHADAAAAHARALDPLFTSRAPSRRSNHDPAEEAQRSALMVVGSPQLGGFIGVHRLTGEAVSARAACPVVVVRKQVSDHDRHPGSRRHSEPADQNAAEFAFQEPVGHPPA